MNTTIIKSLALLLVGLIFWSCAGDDLPDLSAIKLANMGFTVPNAHPFIRKHADYCTTLCGGEGAVREICDLILCAKGLIDDYYNAYLG